MGGRSRGRVQRLFDVRGRTGQATSPTAILPGPGHALFSSTHGADRDRCDGVQLRR